MRDNEHLDGITCALHALRWRQHLNEKYRHRAYHSIIRRSIMDCALLKYQALKRAKEGIMGSDERATWTMA